MKTSFLPEGFENLKTERPYWKMSQMKEGENRLRIIARPIAGWLDWKDGKPIRFRPDQRPAAPVDASKPIKPFWAMHVWDYERNALFVLEVTQSSIIKTLTGLACDKDWGDFTQYDLKISKEGSGKETKYVVRPVPHKPLTEQMLKAIASTPIRLEALYEGGDPWNDLNTSKVSSIYITDDQAKDMERLFVGKEKLKENFLKWLQVESFNKIPGNQFEKALNAIHDRLAKGVA